MHEDFIDKVVIIRLKEPEPHSGRTSFSAKLVEEQDNKLLLENKKKQKWIINCTKVRELILSSR
jgi:ribosome maturation factor RimP